jgi:hypothetical protein
MGAIAFARPVLGTRWLVAWPGQACTVRGVALNGYGRRRRVVCRPRTSAGGGHSPRQGVDGLRVLQPDDARTEHDAKGGLSLPGPIFRSLFLTANLQLRRRTSRRRGTGVCVACISTASRAQIRK